LVEQLTFNQWVAGSNPARLTTLPNENNNLTRLQVWTFCAALSPEALRKHGDTGWALQFRIIWSRRARELPQLLHRFVGLGRQGKRRGIGRPGHLLPVFMRFQEAGQLGIDICHQDQRTFDSFAGSLQL
jgi:hypothetical protein